MDLVKRFYPRSSKKPITNESKLTSLYRRKSKKSNHHKDIVQLAHSDDSEEENDDNEDIRMELYKKKHQQKIKAVENRNDFHQKLNKSAQLVALSAKYDSDDSFYHYHTYPNRYTVNREYQTIPSSMNQSSATEKKSKQVDNCTKVNFLHREGDQDSPIGSPFTKRPEFIESNYIPLPTVTRKYIDPPPDVILDAIPSLVYPSKTRHTSQEAEAAPNVSQSNSNTTTNIREKPKVNLKINTSQLNVQHNQMKLGQEKQISMPDIDTWLSQTI
ncbi:hypothetical protein BD560DRAFT_402756, partial [Blakeslea trispora]